MPGAAGSSAGSEARVKLQEALLETKFLGFSCFLRPAGAHRDRSIVGVSLLLHSPAPWHLLPSGAEGMAAEGELPGGSEGALAVALMALAAPWALPRTAGSAWS